MALELLGKPRVFASPVVEGVWVGYNARTGGALVPAPATLTVLGACARHPASWLRGAAWAFVTPTGAALLAEFVENFGPMQNLVAEKIGFGAVPASRKQNAPNVLRAV